MSGKAKISDVAREAGVSTATVSRALSRPEAVAEKTRAVVVEAAKRTGYRINLAARNLRQQRTGAVVVLVPNLGNPFFSEIIAGVENILTQRGLNVLVVDTLQHRRQPDNLMDALSPSRADAIICLDGALPRMFGDRLLESGVAPMLFACEWAPASTLPAIQVDNAQGAALAIRHLAELGHRDIGHVCGPADNVLTTARSDGTRASLASLSLDINEDWFFGGDFNLDAGIRAADWWLSLKRRPTALFCASDELALGLIGALSRQGISVPNDLSVVGFDDIEIARHYVPALTTIAQPRMTIGQESARLALRIMDNANGAASEEVRPIVLPVNLVVRDSTAEVSSV